MKQIGILICSILLVFSLAACTEGTAKPQMISSIALPPVSSFTPTPVKLPDNSTQPVVERQIEVTTATGDVMRFELNNSIAAKEFYEQLPLFIPIENYSSNEKIFYLPNQLNTSDAPLAKGSAGTLSYYVPWGNVAIYYGDCGGAIGLYALGTAIFGTEFISAMTGEITVTAVHNNVPSLEPTVSENVTTSQSPLETSKADTSETTTAAPSMPNLSAQETVQPESTFPEKTTIPEENAMRTIQVTIGNKTFLAALEENEAANAFAQQMKTEPIVLTMSDYSGFEKVGSLSVNLPASNNQMTTQSGDIVLYNGNQIVVFYGSNSWSYTKLGRINDLSGWEEALGSGDVTITFSIQ